MERAVKVIVLLVTLALVVALVVAGVVQQRMDLTVVAVALVGYLGYITRSLFGIKEDPP